MRWLLEEKPKGAEQNMAEDAALLAEMAAGAGPPAVRVYTWDGAAVSIGRLQAEAPVRALYPLPIVRRPTGGRAVLHGEDLTISVAVRLEHLPEDCRSVMASHHLIMGAVLRTLQSCKIEACFGGCAIADQKNIINCFELSAACDLIDGCTGKKLVGSAQRREGAAVLQQMSLPQTILPDRNLFLQHLQIELQQTFREEDCETGFIHAPFAV